MIKTYHDDYFNLSFTVLKEVPYGKAVYLCGSYPNIGSWNPYGALKLKWTEKHFWHAKIPYRGVRNEVTFQYKYFISDDILLSNSEIEWEQGPNRSIKCKIDNKFMKIIEDIWDKLKIVFRFAMNKDVHRMYIYGNLPEMGYIAGQPLKMDLRVKHNKKRKNGNQSSTVKIWEKEFFIPSTCEMIQYRYGKKDKRSSDIIWEREPNRFCNMTDLKYFKNGAYDPVQDALGLKQKTTISFVFKNSRYVRLDTTFVDHFIYSKVTDKVSLGPYPDYEEIVGLAEKGFSAILNLQTPENMRIIGLDNEKYKQIFMDNHVAYVNLPIKDKVDLNPEKCLLAARQLKKLVDGYKQVFVHCSEGVNRSPAVVVFYLHLYQGYGIWKAFDYVKKKRKRCKVTRKAISDIYQFLNSKKVNGGFQLSGPLTQ